MAFFSKIYRTVIPREKRQVLYDKFLGNAWQKSIRMRLKAKSKFHLYFNFILSNTEKHKAYVFMGKHGLTLYPDEYYLKYKNLTISPLFDDDLEMYYVLHHDRKLYFPQHFWKELIVDMYRGLIAEQDKDSAHKYVNDYCELKDKILLDVGAAEGIFSLDTIDYTKHVYLFECDERWIKALNASFEPWSDKVTIIRKYVDVEDSKSCVTLDTFMSDKDKDNVFIKMDIEGMERLALQGGRKLLAGHNVAFSICVYHHAEDAKVVSSFLSQHGYNYEFSKGYLSMGPGLRKGLLRSIFNDTIK